ENRGYTEYNLGCPILEACGHLGKYFYTKNVDYKTLQHIDVAGLINDADVLINLSHVKGHGSCGYGGACKNIAMGCVTDRTRYEIHSLEGGITWQPDLCTHCEQCIAACNHNANRFDEQGVYQVNYHNCTACQHCVKVCPAGALVLTGQHYLDFQTGMAVCTKAVLDTFDPADIYHINFLIAITAVCDCWGMTTPSLVPDIGIMASPDIVAVEKASLDAVKIENLIRNGIPTGHEMTGQGHLFEQLHGKNPFVQVNELERLDLGRQEYELEKVL
ncbi:MAG TPA: 4Fe-4S ferredoxin, partial [Clostridiales bacterium]|nr:4Fe-4S ferredoxin [Clostridiales bacterium]